MCGVATDTGLWEMVYSMGMFYRHVLVCYSSCSKEKLAVCCLLYFC